MNVSLTLQVTQTLEHQGMCDASGAIPLDDRHFVVASDEDNILRLYNSDRSGPAIVTVDINDYFPDKPQGKEVDIEAATQIGDTVYWITSHGRNKSGKDRPERQQFFATRISYASGQLQCQQIGQAYTQLLDDLVSDRRLQSYGLEAAAQLPPKAEGGLNIEGLAATPAGQILIGWRNPIPASQALIVPLHNPADLVTKSNARAEFGDPVLLDLDGMGIRSLEYWPSQKLYLVVAGAYDGSDRFATYTWSGRDGDRPQPLPIAGLPPGFRPESISCAPGDSQRLHLLSDDGSILLADNLPCKELPPEQRYFRSLWATIIEKNF
jgi:Protein of unknown function (DUF3616)